MQRIEECFEVSLKIHEEFKDALCQLALCLLPFLCFLGFVRGGVVAHEDAVSLFIPTLEHLRQSLLHGLMPLWNPYLLAGQTMAGFQNTPIYYPPNFLVRWFSPERYIVWTCLAHMALGNAGHWKLARNWSMSRPAAFCVAIFLGFSASVYSEMERFPALQILSWLPWFVLALERGLRGSRRYLALASLILALQILCAFLQIVFLEGILVAVLAALMWLPLLGWRRVLGGLTAVTLPALLVSSPYLICLSDYMSNNIRNLATPSYYQVYPLSVKELAYNLVYATPEPYCIPPLIILLAFCAIAHREAPARLRRACWLLVGVGFVLALANDTRFEPLVSWVPLYKTLRYRSRFVVLSSLALGWLAGLGVDTLLTKIAPGKRRLTGSLFGLLAMLSTLPNAATKNICYDFNSIRSVTAYRLLPRDQGFYRILVLPHLRNQYWNWGVFYNVVNLGGYNGAGDLSVQKLLHHAEYGTELNERTAKTTLDRNLIRLRVKLDAPILRNFCLRYSLSSVNARSSPVLTECKLPTVAHAFLPGRLHRTDENEAIRQMSREDFDPQEDCYLEELPAEVQAMGVPVSCEFIAVNSDLNRVRLPVQPTARLLVLSEVYDRGWQASAGGQRLVVTPVNIALRGVIVPAGVTEVELVYRPRGIRWGFPLTLLGLLLMAGVGWQGTRRTPPVAENPQHF